MAIRHCACLRPRLSRKCRCKAMRSIELGHYCTKRHNLPIAMFAMCRLLQIVAMCLVIGGCASTGAVPRPFPAPGGSSAGGEPRDPTVSTVPARPSGPVASADGYSISSTALGLRGSPYRNGGDSPKGFDCSGLVQYVFAQHGVSMPREVRLQYQVGNRVDTAALEPGDLVFFTTNAPGVSHVGIIVGGDQFVHAPSDSGVVRVDHLSAPYWSLRFIGAKRVN